MNNKKIIQLIICLILVASVLCTLLFAGNESGTNTEAEQHFQRANELHINDDYDAAIAEYEAVIQLSPNSKIAQNAQYWIGQLYFEIRQFDAALSSFQKLLDDYPASTIIPSTRTMIERVQQAKLKESLFEAVTKGDIEQVKKLISEGADVNAENSRIYNRTPLHIAAYEGHKDIAELLISIGADIGAKDIEGCTPIYWAVVRGNKEIVDLLITADADVSDAPIFSVMSARNSNRDIVELLIKAGANVPPLQLAAYRGNLQEVSRLLQEGIPVDSQNDFIGTALHTAAAGDQLKVAELLISRGADINANLKNDLGPTPLHIAVNRSHLDMAEFLIGKGAEVNADDDGNITPLHHAAWNGNLDIAKLLISNGADINMKNNSGATPLITAASRRRKEMSRLNIAPPQR